MFWMVQVCITTLCIFCDVALHNQKLNMPVNWSPFDTQIITASFSTPPNIHVGPGVEDTTSVLYVGSL